MQDLRVLDGTGYFSDKTLAEFLSCSSSLVKQWRAERLIRFVRLEIQGRRAIVRIPAEAVIEFLDRFGKPVPTAIDHLIESSAHSGALTLTDTNSIAEPSAD